MSDFYDRGLVELISRSTCQIKWQNSYIYYRSTISTFKVIQRSTQGHTKMLHIMHQLYSFYLYMVMGPIGNIFGVISCMSSISRHVWQLKWSLLTYMYLIQIHGYIMCAYTGRVTSSCLHVQLFTEAFMLKNQHEFIEWYWFKHIFISNWTTVQRQY